MNTRSEYNNLIAKLKKLIKQKDETIKHLGEELRKFKDVNQKFANMIQELQAQLGSLQLKKEGEKNEAEVNDFLANNITDVKLHKPSSSKVSKRGSPRKT